MPDPLAGKVVVITGASSGVGEAAARAFARAGAKVVLAARSSDKIASLAQALGGLAVPTDVSRLADLQALVDQAVAAYGRIDVLVNNAGIRVRKPFGAFSHEEFERVVAINLRAPFFASQAVVPIMRAQGGGHVIHMASQLGLVASRYGAVYNLTKAGLIQLTRSMALELSKDGISVNAVCPGPVSTEGFVAGRNPGELEQRARDVPIGRFGTVEEVAGVVAFLVSKDAGYVIGHALVMDGGYIVH